MESLQSKGKESKCLIFKTSLSGAKGKSKARFLPLKRDSNSLKFSLGAHPTAWVHASHLSPNHLPILLLEGRAEEPFPLWLLPQLCDKVLCL